MPKQKLLRLKVKNRVMSEWINEIDNYTDAVSYIMAIPRFSGKTGPEYTKAILHRMYNRCDASQSLETGTGLYNEACKIFHIAGTNGKGSVCAYLTSLHRAHGISVATFTSPHLVDVRERIMIDGVMVDEEQFFQGFLVVRDTLREVSNEEFFEGYSPTYFEWFFLIGAVIWSKCNPDAIVLETGLGGRLDATNCVPRKNVAVITEIGFDHMQILGDTIAKIAYEKAGIIAPHTPVVTIKNKKESYDVICRQAEDIGSPCITLNPANKNSVIMRDKNIDFSYESRYYNTVTLPLESRALYQVENATLALRAFETVYPADVINLDRVREGLLAMKWPGRMEEITDGVFFDGAHNVDGIERFLESVAIDGCTGVRRLVFSAVSDKQASRMIQMIAESKLFATVATGALECDRRIETDILRELLAPIEDARIFDDVNAAYDAMVHDKTAEDYVYVCGSLYLVAQLKEHI